MFVQILAPNEPATNDIFGNHLLILVLPCGSPWSAAELGYFDRFRGDVTAISTRKLSPSAQEFWRSVQVLVMASTILMVSSREAILTTWSLRILGKMRSCRRISSPKCGWLHAGLPIARLWILVIVLVFFGSAEIHVTNRKFLFAIPESICSMYCESKGVSYYSCPYFSPAHFWYLPRF